MIVSVVGTRPQFIKASILHRTMPHDVIDTGQHYDYSMAGQYMGNMQAHPLSSAGDVAGMYRALLPKLRKYDTIVVYGDCNTTLAGALATKRLGKKLVHIEAGCRSFDRRMVEESIRITVDHLADLNLCPTQTALQNLTDESAYGLFVGDLSWDYIKTSKFVNEPLKHGLVTIHRAENMERMDEILDILESTNLFMMWPMHPKMRRYTLPDNVEARNPLSYDAMLNYLYNAPFIITDSGGLQKEAYMLKTKCITLRDNTEWSETLVGGWNTLAGTDKDKVLRALEKEPEFYTDGLFGDGHSAERIKNEIERLDRTGGKGCYQESRTAAGHAAIGRAG